ncbi:MAG: hypothetical protein EKK42_15640 [Pseudonocardiaceae bacterium]|nr:MAG: hypothetical protein EKK42_15640 [Pseudonocardiaceae bacterium]
MVKLTKPVSLVKNTRDRAVLPGDPTISYRKTTRVSRFRPLVAVLVVLVALVFVAGAFIAGSADRVVRVDADTLTDHQVEMLLPVATSDPTDGCECLYVSEDVLRTAWINL